MFDFIKKLFGGSTVNYSELIENGAVIVDVRTPQEYRSGNIRGSLNMRYFQKKNRYLYHFLRHSRLCVYYLMLCVVCVYVMYTVRL